MFCSTIIPTVGRSSLSRAVESVLQQETAGEEFEVIVVNDSGSPLAPADWQAAERVRLLHTNKRERSVARNTGAAAARGRYLHFLDDDDWMEPGALVHLHQLAGQCDAAWLYGSTQVRDRQGQPILQLQHGLDGNCFLPAMAGEWIPLQASLIDAKVFFAVGGFNPLLAGPEDIDLLRRIALAQSVAGTDAIVTNILVGDVGSTTDRGRHPVQSRWARELILDAPSAFARLEDSLEQQPLSARPAWHGRVVRIYLTSAVWNLQRRRFWSSLSRVGHAVAGTADAGGSVFSSGFWGALRHAYASSTFARGVAAVQNRADG